MSITVVCPACGGKMSAPSQLLGRMAKCPRCAKAIKVVPSADSPAPGPLYQAPSTDAGGPDKRDPPAAEKQAATKSRSASFGRRIGLPVAGSIVSLAAGVIGVLWLGRPESFLGTSGKQNGHDQVATSAATVPNHDTTTVGPPRSTEQGDVPWVDAGTSPIQRGDLRVQVTSVAVRNVRIRDVLGEESVSPTKELTIGIRVENTSPTRKIDFLGWSGAAANTLTLAELLAGGGANKRRRSETLSLPNCNAASLTDSFGNPCRRISLDMGAHIPGQIRTATSLGPGKRLDDLLVFEPPVDEVQFLRLELPAAAFGDTGILRLQIPREMIRR